MTTLDPDTNHVVLINTFTVRPERADELLALLNNATEQVMRHLPGFVSANLHMGEDGTRVANYAQWASIDDFKAMLKDRDAQGHMKAAEALAESYDPQLYRLRHVHEGDDMLPDALSGPGSLPV